MHRWPSWLCQTLQTDVFEQGNCKFGAKCALAHILPDGRRVNRPNMGANGGHFNLGGRVSVTHNAEDAANSSLLTMQAHMAPLPPSFAYPPLMDDLGPLNHSNKSPFDAIPTIDTTFSSHAGSTYGSPPTDGRLPISPGQKGLSLLDVPLPASFDSQGISHMARYGPIAASVPSKFGFESPPSSLPINPPPGGSSALRTLHDSAFGDDGPVGRLAGLGGSSPPAVHEEVMGRRTMHSERFSRTNRPMSNSLGAQFPIGGGGDEWDGNFAFEEDLVPRSLHDLLTPQEKMRRLSHTDEDSLAGHRQSLSGLGTPADPSSKVGSPVTSSPSRFVGALFPRAHTKAENNPDANLAPGASPFGHVGSPLRNSSLHPGASPSLRPIPKPLPGDLSPSLSSPPRQGTVGMSIITQQLRGVRISARPEPADPSLTLHPGMARVASGSSTGSSASRLDRAVSSGSINRDRIDEEQGLFSMEEEEQSVQAQQAQQVLQDEMNRNRKSDGSAVNGKRYSWGLGFGGGGSSSRGSPNLRPLGGQRGNSATGGR